MGVAKEEGLLTQENREKELRTGLKAGLSGGGLGNPEAAEKSVGM